MRFFAPLRMTNELAVLAVEVKLRVKCFCEDKLDVLVF